MASDSQALLDLLGAGNDGADIFAEHLASVLSDPLSSLRVGPLPGLSWKGTVANVKRHFLSSVRSADTKARNAVDVSVLLVRATKATDAVIDDEKVTKPLIRLLHRSPLYKSGWILDDEWVSFAATVIAAMKQRKQPELIAVSRVGFDESAIDLFKKGIAECLAPSGAVRGKESVLLDLVVTKSARG